MKKKILSLTFVITASLTLIVAVIFTVQQQIELTSSVNEIQDSVITVEKDNTSLSNKIAKGKDTLKEATLKNNELRANISSTDGYLAP